MGQLPKTNTEIEDPSPTSKIKIDILNGEWTLALKLRYSEKATKNWPIFHLEFDATKQCKK